MQTAEKTTVIEPEILDETGAPIATAPTPSDPSRVYRGAGVWAGFVALVFSFVMMLLMAIVSLFFIVPLLLLGRLLGLRLQKFRR